MFIHSKGVEGCAYCVKSLYCLNIISFIFYRKQPDSLIPMMRKMMMMLMKMMFPAMRLLLMIWFPLMVFGTRGSRCSNREVLMGLLLDYEVFSKNCFGYASTKVKNMTDNERKEWEKQHKSTL